MVCRFDLSLQHKKRTGVLVLCLEVHCPVGHLHVQSGYRFLHILRQPLWLLLGRHKVLQLVIRLRWQFEQHGNFLSNFRVGLIPISSSKDLILSLYPQLLFNSSETQRLLADPPKFKVPSKSNVSNPIPNALIRYLIRLAFHPSQSLEFIAAVGAKKYEDMFEALECSLELILTKIFLTWLGYVVAHTEQSLAFWMLS